MKMKLIITLVSLLIFAILPLTQMLGQENVWSETYESREEFNNVIELVTTNLVLSGKTHELGNKSDIVVLANQYGKELKRVVLCESCLSGEVVQSLETSNGEILHFRPNGDLYSSDLDLNETNFEFNISEDLFENIETYQILKYNHFLIAVSYAVDHDDVKGLLHTVMDSRNKKIYSQKFNVEFPDIAGSVGIGIFDDQGVVDGYNTDEAGQSVGHLVRLGRYRDIIWEVDLDFGSIVIEHPLVARNQQIYAVGSIKDENNPNHTQGLVVSYDGDGNLLWTKEFNAEGNDGNFEFATMVFENIEQLSDDEFVITGREGGVSDGNDFSSALIIVVDSEGNLLRRYNSSLLSTDVDASDVVKTRAGELVYVAKSFKNNSIIGSYVSGTERTSSIEELQLEDISLAYPNPATESIFLNVEIAQGAYEIIDLAGQVVLRGDIAGPSISVAEIDNGMYIIKLLESNKKTRLMKFMKL